jgi:hypothetical protein
MMSEDSKYSPNELANKMRQMLATQSLAEPQVMELEVLMQIRDILEEMLGAGKVEEMAISLGVIEQELAQLIARLDKGGDIEKRDVIMLLLYVVRLRYRDKHALKKKSVGKGDINQENPLDFMSKEQLLAYKKHIERMIQYEMHKFSNPHRLAGETLLDNFMNNMLKGGIELAKLYEGGNEQDIRNYGKEFVDTLEHKHQEMVRPNGPEGLSTKLDQILQHQVGHSQGGGGRGR